MNKFTFSAQDLIGKYDIAAFHFMKKIFDMNCHEMALSDESWLSDFTGCGLDDQDWNHIADLYETLDTSKMKHCDSQRAYQKIQNEYWDNWVTQKIEEQYLFIISKTNYPLHEIFKHIVEKFDTKELEKENATFTFVDDTSVLVPVKRPETPEEIQKVLKTTFNPFFYAHHTGISLRDAKELMERRQDERLGVYRAYRP